MAISAVARVAALKNVDFYIDGRKIASLTQPPFIFPWEAVQGNHTLTVKATDWAGNTSEVSVEFIANP